MSKITVQIRGWKRVVLIVLITIGAIWGGLKWAEKAYAKFQFKMRDTCWGYEFHSYLAFSPLDRIFPLRDRPIFVRVVEKKTGRLYAETGVYWIEIGPDVICLEREHPKQIKIYFSRGPSDERLESFDVPPP